MSLAFVYIKIVYFLTLFRVTRVLCVKVVSMILYDVTSNIQRALDCYEFEKMRAENAQISQNYDTLVSLKNIIK